MENKIYIKAWFSGWHEATFEKACSFFKGMLEGGACKRGLIETFPKHFKGVTVEEILKEIEK